MVEKTDRGVCVRVYESIYPAQLGQQVRKLTRLAAGELISCMGD